MSDSCSWRNGELLSFSFRHGLRFIDRSSVIDEKSQQLLVLFEKSVQLEAQGQYDEAAAVAKRALTLAEGSLNPDHPNVATSLSNLAWLYDNQGQYAQAEPLYKRALAIFEKGLGPDHPYVATV